VVMQAGLHRGQELGDEELVRLLDSDSAEKAYDRSLNFLSFRPRSTAEVRRNLEARKTPPEVIDQVVERLRSGGLLDDAAFARTWVENRAAFSPRGARLLGYELRQKGVAAEDLEAALPEDDEAGAVEAARRKSRQFHHLEFNEYRQKMLAYLQRRGFGYEAAAAAVKAAWEESREQ